MDLLSENKEYVLAVSIPLTVLVLVASMAYTIRNISRIWSAGKPVGVADEAKSMSDSEENLDDDDEEKDEQNEDENEESEQGNRNIDPVQYCEHIQSEVKKARHRVATQEIRQKLTPEDMENEREIQRKQIEDIFKLMEQHSDKFGVASEDDVRQQMKLYV